jgi:hypothetical protein
MRAPFIGALLHLTTARRGVVAMLPASICRMRCSRSTNVTAL